MTERKRSSTEPQGTSEAPTGPLDPPLPLWLRVLLFTVGAALLIVGLVALALPVVPQALPLLGGAALLSLASDRLYLFLRTRLRRWPWVWRPLRAFRLRVHAALARRRDPPERADDDTSP